MSILAEICTVSWHNQPSHVKIIPVSYECEKQIDNLIFNPGFKYANLLGSPFLLQLFLQNKLCSRHYGNISEESSMQFE